jgi:hypothetical protein
MQDQHRRLCTQASPALWWTLLFFLVGHATIGFYLHRRHPEFFDPEVTLRLSKLSARLAESPGRPLALAIGSSRIELGLQPASVMEQTKDVASQPLLFNFSMLGAGPVAQRMTLHRLIHKGIQPKWLFLEVWPPILTQAFPFAEDIRAFHRDVYWSDVSILGRLYDRRWEAVGQAVAQTLTPLLQYREGILQHYAPRLLSPMFRQTREVGFDKYVLYHLDDFGWVDNSLQTDPAHPHTARSVIKPLFDHFTINDISDRALHDLLMECRRHDIQVLFVLMPDHSLIRSWYPSIQRDLMPYLRRLSVENHAPILDARTWQPDENIPDCVHLSQKGARAFSERFGREVFRPLIQGKPLDQDILMGDSE